MSDTQNSIEVSFTFGHNTLRKWGRLVIHVVFRYTGHGSILHDIKVRVLQINHVRSCEILRCSFSQVCRHTNLLSSNRTNTSCPSTNASTHCYHMQSLLQPVLYIDCTILTRMCACKVMHHRLRIRWVSRNLRH